MPSTTVPRQFGLDRSPPNGRTPCHPLADHLGFCRPADTSLDCPKRDGPEWLEVAGLGPPVPDVLRQQQRGLQTFGTGLAPHAKFDELGASARGCQVAPNCDRTSNRLSA